LDSVFVEVSYAPIFPVNVTLVTPPGSSRFNGTAEKLSAHQLVSGIVPPAGDSAVEYLSVHSCSGSEADVTAGIRERLRCD
jgi:hypothetical protein